MSDKIFFFNSLIVCGVFMTTKVLDCQFGLGVNLRGQFTTHMDHMKKKFQYIPLALYKLRV